MGLKRLNPKTLVVFGIALLMAGCDPVLSLHPLSTGKDLVFEPALVGTWVDREGENTLTFQMTFQKFGDVSAKVDAYEVIYTEKGVPAKFIGYLVRLGEFLFLGAFPHPKESLVDFRNSFYATHLVPAHTFSRISIQGDELHLALLTAKWVKEVIDQKKVEIPHHRLGDGVILIGSPDDLQKLVLKATQDSKAFFEPLTWHRQKTADLCPALTTPLPLKPLTATELSGFTSDYGYLVRAKKNRTDRILIVVGEYHQFREVQDDVYCLIKEITSVYNNISFLGFEERQYDGGKTYNDGTKLRRKEMMGLPVIGIEGQLSRERRWWQSAIDSRHRELARKNMEKGLSPEEQVEYAHVSNLSVQLIVKLGSRGWIDNVRDFMDKNGVNVGLINTGFAHFPSIEEKLNQYGYSYALILPNSARNYCECEAHWVKRKPDASLPCKSVCENPQVKPVWD